MLMLFPIIVQGEVYRSMWEKAMDEVLDRLVQVSSDGLTYVGVISVAKKAGSKGTFKPKVNASSLMLCHACNTFKTEARVSCAPTNIMHALLRLPSNMPTCMTW